MLRSNNEYFPTAASIISSVSKYYGVEENALRGESRIKEIANARHIAIYLIRHMTNLSLADIGKEFGKDHTTALYSVQKIDAQMKNDPALAQTIREITTNINVKK